MLQALTDEVRGRFESGTFDADLDPLGWWSSPEQDGLSGLKPVVQAILCIPASTAAAERSFSNTQFVAEGRENLSGETIEHLAVIRDHLYRMDKVKYGEFIQRAALSYQQLQNK